MNFTCLTNRSLIDLLTGKDLGLTLVHQRQGYADIYLIDSQGDQYPVNLIGECWLAATIPPASKDFTLYLPGLPPFEVRKARS